MHEAGSNIGSSQENKLKVYGKDFPLLAGTVTVLERKVEREIAGERGCWREDGEEAGMDDGD